MQVLKQKRMYENQRDQVRGVFASFPAARPLMSVC